MPYLMCQSCINSVVENAKEHGLAPSEKEIGEFLWNCTCFPFGCTEQVQEQVVEAFSWIDEAGNPKEFRHFLNFAMGKVLRQMDEQMEALKKSHPEMFER